MTRVAPLACALVLALASTTPALRAEEAPAGASAPKGRIEQLVADRKLEDAIRAVDEMRKTAPGGFADADSEFFAARAQMQLKQTEPARERFLKVASTYPTHPRAGAAAIEASTSRLSKLEGKAETPAAKKTAFDAARELEATAAKFASSPETAARAWYVAGNAWRTGGDEAAAEKAYRQAAAQKGDEYPPKADFMLGVMAAKRFDAAGARAIFTDCVKDHPASKDVERCRKGLARLMPVGKPAPGIEAETWVSGKPVDLAAEKGHVVVLWFFATWCPHCKETMPAIAAMKSRFATKPVTFVAVTANTKGQTTDAAAAFVADPQWGFTYPVAVDRGSATTDAFEAAGIPQAVLIDKKGVVRWADHPTYLTDDMVERLLAE